MSEKELTRSKKKSIFRKWKKEYYRTVDGLMRSYAVSKLLKGFFYSICVITTLILAVLLYIGK